MEEVHKKALDTARPKLVENLNFKTISDKLGASDIFTRIMLEDIQAQRTNGDKIRQLLDDLRRRGPDAYGKFIEVLKESQCGHAVDAIENKMREKTNTYVPGQTVSYAVSNSDVTDARCDDDRRPSNASRQTLDCEKYIYQMDFTERGLALIINNIEFPGKKKRVGAKVDEQYLEERFEELCFDVTIKRDQSADQMKALLKKFAAKDHSKKGCFVCIILSHGNKGVVQGIDGQTIDIIQIIDPFKGNNCKSLSSKPKLFFIQACRGDADDGGVQRDSMSMDNIIKIPQEADILVHYATVEGYAAWRDPEQGSWFIQALSKQLELHGNTMELLRLLTRVNGDVASNFESPGGVKQVPHIASQLTRELYFRPKK